MKIRCGIITEASRCPVAGTTQLLKQIAEISPGTDDTVCVEYCTGSEEKLVTTFTSCLETKGIHLAGGTVFGVPDGKPPVVAYNGELYEDACVYALIKNTTGKIRVYKENIYEKTSAQSHFATKVDVSRKALIELDGRPAADVYSAELGIPRDKIVDNVLVNPMGRAVGNQVFISSMNGMDTDGTLTNYKRINKNDCIYFLSLGDYKATEQQTRQQIQQDASHISLVLSIDFFLKRAVQLIPHAGVPMLRIIHPAHRKERRKLPTPPIPLGCWMTTVNKRAPMLKAWGLFFQISLEKRVSAGGRGNHPLQVPLKKRSVAWTERKVLSGANLKVRQPSYCSF